MIPGASTLHSSVQANIEHRDYVNERYRRSQIKVFLVCQQLGANIIKFHDLNEP